MSFLRHVGKINDRKVAIIFREVPNEPHMCLVTYTETLNRHIHDPMMKSIESDIGQHSENLADALNRSYTTDGKVILHVLHSQGLIKKVQTAQVLVTPNSSTAIKLAELNKILDEMKQGESAVKRMAEIDASRGIQDPADIARRMRDMQKGVEVVQPASDGVLGNNALANNLRAQADRMTREANGLMSEAQRLNEEARAMDPSILPATIALDQPVAKKRGRPAKTKVTA